MSPCMSMAEVEAMIPALRAHGLDLCDCEYFARAALQPLPAPRPMRAKANSTHAPTAAGPSIPPEKRVG